MTSIFDTDDSLVSTDWLARNMNSDKLVILDGSFKLPGVIPRAEEDFVARHIPRAQFFDIDEIADRDVALPHMLPSAADFARAVEILGVSNESFVVVYDMPGLMSAASVWWMFKVFGHKRIAILDGGIKAWSAEQRPLTAEKYLPTRGSFNAILDPKRVASKADMLENLVSGKRQVIDARSAARFNAEEKEARPGLRSGHIPGSINVPFNTLTYSETGKVRELAEMDALFRQAGFDPTLPVTVTCGSGVTACALAFGLHLMGSAAVKVYDGAWAEWGMPGGTPVTS